MFLYCVKALNASYLVLRSRRNPWQHPTARLIEFLCVSAVSSLLVAAMPRCEGVNELPGREDSPPKLGGVAAPSRNAAKPPKHGADGVVPQQTLQAGALEPPRLLGLFWNLMASQAPLLT